MKVAVGYIRPRFCDHPEEDAEDQKRAIVAEQERLRPLGYARGWFCVDAPERAGKPLRERAGGRVLNKEVLREFHVIVPRLASFADLADLLTTASCWKDRGITLAVLDVPGLDTAVGADHALAVIGAVAKAQKERAGERLRQGHRTRKALGKVPSGRAKFGFKFTGRKGYRRRVPDEDERAVMKKIVQWRDEGHTWERIYHHLWQHGIKRRDGKEWTEPSVRRAYRAEMALREQECLDTPGGLVATPVAGTDVQLKP